MTMAYGSFWNELGRDRERRRRADTEAPPLDGRRAAARRRPAASPVDGAAEAARRQAEVDARLTELTGVLRAVVAAPVPTIADLTGLAAHAPVVALAAPVEEAPQWADFLPRGSGLFARFRQARAEADAHARFDAAFAEFDRRRAESRGEHATRAAEQREEYARRVDALLTATRHGNPDAPPELAAAVLDTIAALRGLVRGGRGVYQPAGRELTVEVDLPGPDVVPVEGQWRFVAERRVLEAVHRAPAERAAVYAGLVGQAALAVLSACFRAFPADVVDTVTVNGHARGVEPASGHPVRPCLVTVTTSRATFLRLDLARADLEPGDCLRFLGADGSQHPSALWPVRPFVDVDRLLRHRDAAAGAQGERTTDLMAMEPREFEDLVAALFRAKGFAAWHTRSSRADRLDGLAVRSDPYTPTECLVAVRRTGDAVPPEDVAALLGALATHPTATNGVLVTTSRLSDRARQRARARGIATMEGAELGLQISEHLGLDVVNSAQAC